MWWGWKDAVKLGFGGVAVCRGLGGYCAGFFRLSTSTCAISSSSGSSEKSGSSSNVSKPGVVPLLYPPTPRPVLGDDEDLGSRYAGENAEKLLLVAGDAETLGCRGGDESGASRFRLLDADGECLGAGKAEWNG